MFIIFKLILNIFFSEYFKSKLNEKLNLLFFEKNFKLLAKKY